MNSYRDSHVDSEVAGRYGQFFERRVDSLVWDEFVKPWLQQVFEDVSARGGRTYLDFACGTGRILKQGARFFDDPTGLDISSQMLARASEHVPGVTLHCLDVTQERSDHIGCFDCVSLFRFLRNAEPELRELVLDWIWRHTNDEATLVVNNHGHSASIPGLVQRLAFWLPADKRNLLSERQTCRLLEQAGFRIVECRGFQILPGLFGRPMLGRRLQGAIERVLLSLGLGRFGYELVIVAKRRGRGAAAT